MTAAYRCTTCLALVSARIRHPGAQGCWPPDPVETRTVMWSTDPPFQAWPSAHVHRRHLRPPTLTSPVEGVAASTLVALCRQQASDPRAPTETFRRLLGSEPAGVVEQVRRPRPALVACGGGTHRLELHDGRLTALDHPGADPELEALAVALGGPEPPACLTLLTAWRDRRITVLRRRGLWHLLVLDTARAWADAGADAEARDAWTGRGLGPDQVLQSAAQGVGEDELLRWSRVTLDADEAVRWSRTGWTVREASALSLAGLSADRSTMWLAAGLDVGRVRECLRLGLAPAVAADWWDAGWNLAVASDAVQDGLRLSAANDLHASGVKRKDVLPLLRAGVTAGSDLHRV